MKDKHLREYRVCKRRAEKIQRRIRQEGGDAELLKRVGYIIQSVDDYMTGYNQKMSFLQQEKMNRRKITITLVRHGYSCANLIQDIVKKMPSKTVQEKIKKLMATVKDKRSILSINSALNNIGRLQAYYAATATKREQRKEYPVKLAEYIKKADTWGCSELLRATESGLYFFGHIDKINNKTKPSKYLQFIPYISEEYSVRDTRLAKLVGIDIHKDNIPETIQELQERLENLELKTNTTKKPYPLIEWSNDKSLYWLNKNKPNTEQEIKPTKPSFKELGQFLEKKYLTEKDGEDVHLVLVSHQNLIKSFLKKFQKHNFNPIYSADSYSYPENLDRSNLTIKNYKIQNVGIWNISFTQEELIKVNKKEKKFFTGTAQCLFDSQELKIGDLTINTNRASKSFNVCDLPGRNTIMKQIKQNDKNNNFNSLWYGLPGCGDFSQTILNELYDVCPEKEKGNIIQNINQLYINQMKESEKTQEQPYEHTITGLSNQKKKIFRKMIDNKSRFPVKYQEIIGTLYNPEITDMNKMKILENRYKKETEGQQ